MDGGGLYSDGAGPFSNCGAPKAQCGLVPSKSQPAEASDRELTQHFWDATEEALADWLEPRQTSGRRTEQVVDIDDDTAKQDQY